MNHFKSQSPFILLYTKDVSRTHEFYKSISAEVVELKEDKVVVNLGGFSLHFILGSTEPIEEYKRVMSNGEASSGLGIILYIESSDIEKNFELLKSVGAKFIKEIYSNHWGYREFLFQDPNGYKFAVWG
jgi:predicted enzyme related to lactoylglutathione lyase